MADLKKSVIGSLYYLMDGIGQRIVGIISTMILARILMPDDFGIVAIATLAINFLEVLSKNNSGQIIETQNEIRIDLIDTIFTINFIQKFIVALVFFLLSPAISKFFGMKELEPIFRCISMVLFVLGCANPMLAVMKKRQMYEKLVLASFFSKAVTAIITVILALKLKNYWALIIGQSISYLLPIIAGYIIMPYMPKFTLGDRNRFTLVLKYTCATVPNEIFGYLRSQVDIIAASKLFAVDKLGGFHMVKYYSIIPVHYFLAPMFEPLLVQLSSVKNNDYFYKIMCNVSLITYCAFALPITIFMYAYSSDIINLILGEKWIIFKDIFSLCCVSAFITGFFGVVSKIFIIESDLNKLSNFNLVSLMLLIFSLAFYVLNFEANLKEFVCLKMAIDIVSLFYAIIYLYSKFLGWAAFFTFIRLVILILLFNSLAIFFANEFLFGSGFIALAIAFSVFCSSYLLINYIFLIFVKTNIKEIEYLRFKIVNLVRTTRDN